MNRSLCPLRDANPQLTWAQERAHGVRDMLAGCTLEASRRRVHPTAMGLMPPSLFSWAITVAPKKKGRIEAGQLPLRMWLEREVRAIRRTKPPSSAEAAVMSLRCCGLRLSRHPADPLGKDRIAWATSSSDTVRWL